jgi:hypothetical protein
LFSQLSNTQKESDALKRQHTETLSKLSSTSDTSKQDLIKLHDQLNKANDDTSKVTAQLQKLQIEHQQTQTELRQTNEQLQQAQKEVQHLKNDSDDLKLESQRREKMLALQAKTSVNTTNERTKSPPRATSAEKKQARFQDPDADRNPNTPRQRTIGAGLLLKTEEKSTRFAEDASSKESMLRQKTIGAGNLLKNASFRDEEADSQPATNEKTARFADDADADKSGMSRQKTLGAGNLLKQAKFADEEEEEETFTVVKTIEASTQPAAALPETVEVKAAVVESNQTEQTLNAEIKPEPMVNHIALLDFKQLQQQLAAPPAHHSLYDHPIVRPSPLLQAASTNTYTSTHSRPQRPFSPRRRSLSPGASSHDDRQNTHPDYHHRPRSPRHLSPRPIVLNPSLHTKKPEAFVVPSSTAKVAMPMLAPPPVLPVKATLSAPLPSLPAAPQSVVPSPAVHSEPKPVDLRVVLHSVDELRGVPSGHTDILVMLRVFETDTGNVLHCINSKPLTRSTALLQWNPKLDQTFKAFDANKTTLQAIVYDRDDLGKDVLMGSASMPVSAVINGVLKMQLNTQGNVTLELTVSPAL